MSLFQHYPANPETIRTKAGSMMGAAADVREVKGEVTAGNGVAQACVEGAFDAPVTEGLQPVTTRADGVNDAATFAGLATNHFAGGVDDYNHGIDELNKIWDEAAGSDFGVAAAEYPPGATPQEKTGVDQAHSQAVADARSALLAELQRRKRELDARLDARATEVSGMLGRGPNAKDVASLTAADAIGGIGQVLHALYPHPERTIPQFLGMSVPGAIAKNLSETLEKTVPGSFKVTYEPGRTFVVDPSGETTIKPTRGSWKFSTTPQEIVPDEAGRATAGRWATQLKWGGYAATAGFAAYDEWNKPENQNLATDERVGRSAGNTLPALGGAVVGSLAGSLATGAVAGSTIGSAVPGLGTAVGLVVGLGVGAAVGLGLDKVAGEAVRDAGQWVGDKAGDAIDAAGDVAEDVGSTVSDAWHDLTPW